MKNGIIYNTNREQQTFFFDREYTNIDTKNKNEAAKWIDMKGNKKRKTKKTKY